MQQLRSVRAPFFRRLGTAGQALLEALDDLWGFVAINAMWRERMGSLPETCGFQTVVQPKLLASGAMEQLLHASTP